MHDPTSTGARVLIAVVGFSVVTGPMLYFLIRRASATRLKSIRPWVTRTLPILCGLIWIAMALQTLMDKRSLLASIAWFVYIPVAAAAEWIKSRLLFIDPSSWNTKRMSWLLHIPGHTYVEIKNPSSSAAWYVDKLGLRRLAPSQDADPKVIRLKFSDESEEMRLGPHDPMSLGATIILYSRRLKRAQKVLSEREIDVSPIRVDRQGTNYFEFHDPEGNTIEVCGAQPDF